MGWFTAAILLAVVLVAGGVAAIRQRRGIGRSEGTQRGPRGGEGAVVHDSSGAEDFDGTPGDVMPPPDKPPQDRPDLTRTRHGTS